MDPPAVLGKWRHHSSQLTTVVVRVPQPACQLDPGLARFGGTVGLAVESATGGMCVDLFGFRVLRSEDLILR
jgi:hypothetical protein